MLSSLHTDGRRTVHQFTLHFQVLDCSGDGSGVGAICDVFPSYSPCRFRLIDLKHCDFSKRPTNYAKLVVLEFPAIQHESKSMTSFQKEELLCDLVRRPETAKNYSVISTPSYISNNRLEDLSSQTTLGAKLCKSADPTSHHRQHDELDEAGRKLQATRRWIVPADLLDVLYGVWSQSVHCRYVWLDTICIIP